MILPVQQELERFKEQWLGSVFWEIAARSCRPVLIFRPEEWHSDEMVLFYSNRVESARALPCIARLCSRLQMSLTVYESKPATRKYAREREWEAFFDHHGVVTKQGQPDAIAAITNELRDPGSELSNASILAFDSGFRQGFWFQRPRRLVRKLMHRSRKNIVLCP